MRVEIVQPSTSSCLVRVAWYVYMSPAQPLKSLNPLVRF